MHITAPVVCILHRAIPAGAVALVVLIAIAQSLRELPGVTAFIARHPGIAQDAPSVDHGFPWWLQLQHFLNMVFMLFRHHPTFAGVADPG